MTLNFEPPILAEQIEITGGGVKSLCVSFQKTGGPFFTKKRKIEGPGV